MFNTHNTKVRRAVACYCHVNPSTARLDAWTARQELRK